MPKIGKRDAAHIYQHVKQLHLRQASAETHLDKLMQHLAKAGHLTPTTQQLVVKVWRNVGGTHQVPFGALESLLPPSLTQVANTPTTALTVFGTPELLENILVNLTALDLLHAMQVSHEFKDNIEASPTILRRMGLKVDEDCNLRVPFDESGSLSAHIVLSRSCAGLAYRERQQALHQV
ncbi:hypothetical protein LTR08_001578 [Meristemomyces frigidus]|nr:hypothetical protein LTR08_001578 [Meristemomyces frigidus]